MVLGRAVAQRVRAGRVRSDVAADGAEVARRGIGPETQPVRRGRFLDSRVNGPGLQPRPATAGIDLEHLVHVRGEVEDDPGAEGGAREAGSASTGRDGDAALRGVGEHGGYVRCGLGGHDRERLPPEDARGRGEESESDRVGADFARDPGR